MKRCLILLGVLFGLSWLVVPAASAATINAAPKAYPVTVCSTLSVSSQQARPGESITLTGTNFKANSTVHLELKPKASSSAAGFVRQVAPGQTYDLGSVKTDANGSFTTQITLPDSTTGGGRFIVYATSGARTAQGCPADPFQSLNILAASTATSGGNGNAGGGGASTNGDGGTAFTGLDIAGLVALGLALVGVGAVAARRGRRVSA